MSHLSPARSMRAVTAACVLSALPAAGLAQTASPDQQQQARGDWVIRLGAGFGVGPAYPGGRDYRVGPVPDVSITWRDTVFLDTGQGLGVTVINTPIIRLGASVWMRGGRDEDDADRLRGLGDIDTAVQARIFSRVALGPVDLGATLARDFGGSDGLTVNLNLSSTFRVTERLRITPGIGTMIADDRYMATWFGVSPAQSARSGLPAFDAGAGFVSVGASLRAAYSLTQHWTLAAAVRVERLLGDAADSPITERRTAPGAMFLVNYRF